MSLNRLLSFASVAWCALVITSLGARSALLGAPITPVEVLGWLFVGGAPLVILVSILRGSQSTTIAEVLYITEHASDAKVIPSARSTDGPRR